MNKLPPDWNKIDTVLLDMDGTLLDKYFDDHFWEEFVPAQYALRNGISEEEAKEDLMPRYRSREETLDWANLDYWSHQLDLDIPALKRQVQHLINIHPNVIEFLEKLKAVGKGIYLVTNAHGKTLDLKMERTALAHRFDGIITSHEIGMPKEDPAFWESLGKVVPFDPERTLLGEDTEAVLRSASRFGIRYLVFIANASSAKPPSNSSSYYSIQDFGEIMPE
ncbi:MAG TPA: GMP/IMP nucleotidase [Nitrospiria bacterium]|nr:GMP/IMP nucleotidase [Nitrospiria bacterium]